MSEKPQESIGENVEQSQSRVMYKDGIEKRKSVSVDNARRYLDICRLLQDQNVLAIEVSDDKTGYFQSTV